MAVFTKPVPPGRAGPLANKTNLNTKVGCEATMNQMKKKPLRSSVTTPHKAEVVVATPRVQTPEKSTSKPEGVRTFATERKERKRVEKPKTKKTKKPVKKSNYKTGVTLIPPQPDEWTTVYTVVIDMDETLLWHPKLGVVHERPGATDLLKGLKGRCETVLWTASTRAATEVALKDIGLSPTDFTHIITRDKRWFSWNTPAKDIRFLGRNPDKVLVVENSPFCVRLNKVNGLLVSDFNRETKRDDTLFKVHRIIQNLLTSQLPVPSYLAMSETVVQKNYKLRASAPPSTFFCVA
eukprot:TRINITY_DN4302_c0_g3_i1.p1 TRINITY_DN4302_c0_g3~~TRINITY_DN4302_c0_g3_i1.p1  ORF type:complete len:302 (+),score=44.92 TRINITY_DN4302_c0_g3_i1:27-908(+)